MTVGEAFIKRLNAILKDRGIKRSEFLRENCIPRSTIVNIEKGNTKSPTVALMYQVAYALGISPVEFIDNETMLNSDIDFL